MKAFIAVVACSIFASSTNAQETRSLVNVKTVDGKTVAVSSEEIERAFKALNNQVTSEPILSGDVVYSPEICKEGRYYHDIIVDRVYEDGSALVSYRIGNYAYSFQSTLKARTLSKSLGPKGEKDGLKKGMTVFDGLDHSKLGRVLDIFENGMVKIESHDSDGNLYFVSHLFRPISKLFFVKPEKK